MMFFSKFYHGFRSSQPTADLLKVATYRIARTFNSSGATETAVLDISTVRLLKGFGMLVSFTNTSLIEFHNRFSNLYIFFGNSQLLVVLDGKP